MSGGVKLIFIYLVLELFVPYVLIFLFDIKLNFYDLKPFTFISFIHVVFILAFVFYLTPKRYIFIASGKLANRYTFKFNFLIDLFILILFVVSVVGFVNGIGRWRYENEGISNNLNPQNLLFITLPVFLDFLILVKLFYKFNHSRFLNFASPRLRNLFILFALLLSVTGIGSMISFCVYFVSMLSPSFIESILFRRYKLSVRKIVRRIAILPIVILVTIFSYVYGESIKVGLSPKQVSDYVLSKNYVIEFIPYLIERISPSLVSLSVVLDKYGDTFRIEENLFNLMELKDNLLFRISKIVGNNFSFAKPEFGSIMRLNYIQIINHIPRDREGTSPGLIPGFYMIFPFPLAIIFISIYFSFLIRLFNVLIYRMKNKLSLIGILFLIKLSNNLLASPIDFILVFDPMFISFLLMLYFARAINKGNSKDLPDKTRG